MTHMRHPGADNLAFRDLCMSPVYPFASLMLHPSLSNQMLYSMTAIAESETIELFFCPGCECSQLK